VPFLQPIPRVYSSEIPILLFYALDVPDEIPARRKYFSEDSALWYVAIQDTPLSEHIPAHEKTD
jgi:hypothetical protein